MPFPSRKAQAVRQGNCEVHKTFLRKDGKCTTCEQKYRGNCEVHRSFLRKDGKCTTCEENMPPGQHYDVVFQNEGGSSLGISFYKEKDGDVTSVCSVKSQEATSLGILEKDMLLTIQPAGAKARVYLVGKSLDEISSILAKAERPLLIGFCRDTNGSPAPKSASTDMISSDMDSYSSGYSSDEESTNEGDGGVDGEQKDDAKNEDDGNIDGERSEIHEGNGIDHHESGHFLTCPVCLDPFASEPSKFADKRQSNLPVYSNKCPHKVCCSCLANIQVAAAEEKKTVRKYIECPICKAKGAFNVMDMSIDLFACECARRIGTLEERTKCASTHTSSTTDEERKVESGNGVSSDRISELESQLAQLKSAKRKADSDIEQTRSTKRIIVRRLFKKEVQNYKLKAKLDRSELRLKKSESYKKELSSSMASLRTELSGAVERKKRIQREDNAAQANRIMSKEQRRNYNALVKKLEQKYRDRKREMKKEMESVYADLHAENIRHNEIAFRRHIAHSYYSTVQHTHSAPAYAPYPSYPPVVQNNYSTAAWPSISAPPNTNTGGIHPEQKPSSRTNMMMKEDPRERKC